MSKMPVRASCRSAFSTARKALDRLGIERLGGLFAIEPRLGGVEPGLGTGGIDLLHALNGAGQVACGQRLLRVGDEAVGAGRHGVAAVIDPADRHQMAELVGDPVPDSGIGRERRRLGQLGREVVEVLGQAHAALGDQYSLAGKIPEAISEYEAAIRVKPDYAIAHLNLGLMFVRQGRLDEAVTKFRETLSLEPGNSVARDYLQQVQSRHSQAR